MKATVENVAYIVFFSSFTVWLGLLTYTILMNSIVFPNTFVSTAFLASGATTSVSCGVVGLSYLGININQKSKQPVNQVKLEDFKVIEPIPLEPNLQKKKRAKTAKTPQVGKFIVRDATIEESKQVTHKVRKKRKTKKPKASNIELSPIGSLEEEITKKA